MIRLRRWSHQRSKNIYWPRRWRRHPWAIIVLLLLTCYAYIDHRRYSGWQGPDQDRYHNKIFRCINVVDGDTIDIDVTDDRHPTTRIRLWGVDTPEISQTGQKPLYYGSEASEFTRCQLLNQNVRIELFAQRSRDKFGRLLGFVYIADTGELLNAKLIEAGYGYADDRFDHPFKNTFLDMEQQARQSKAGLWKNVTVEQMPRWRQKSEKGVLKKTTNP